MRKPTKAIIAAAGFGTRFLPQTKSHAKGNVALIDKPNYSIRRQRIWSN